MTEESITPTIKPVNAFNKKILANYVNSSKDISPVDQLLEPPLVTMPPNLHDKYKSNSAFDDIISNSLNEFLRMNHKANELTKAAKPQAKDTPKLTKKQIEEQECNTLLDEQNRINRKKIKTAQTKAFINATVNANANVSECASYILSSYLRKNKCPIELSDVNLYIDPLSKYAFNKQWNEIHKLLNNMAKANVQLTPQVYMIALDCLGRLPASNENTKLINAYLTMAEKKVRFFAWHFF